MAIAIWIDTHGYHGYLVDGFGFGFGFGFVGLEWDLDLDLTCNTLLLKIWGWIRWMD